MNWGHKLTIGMALFMAFISIMVFKMIRSKIDLVSENYYESGIEYQQKIKSEANAENIKDQIAIYYSDSTEVLNISIPKIDKGEVLFYRPSAKNNDFQVNLLSHNAIDLKAIPKGYWKAKLQWSHGTNEYAVEKDFFVNHNIH